MEWTRISALIPVLAALVACAPRALSAPAAPHVAPQLAGTWKLDRARSDDPEKKVQEAMANLTVNCGPGGGPGGGPPGDMSGGPPGDMGGGPPGDMGGGPPDDGGGGPGEDGQSAHGRGAPDIRHLANLPDEFAAQQLADTVAFVDHGIRVRQIVVNGGHKLSARSDTGIEQASGRWKKEQLVAENRSEHGHGSKETWELINKGGSLLCTTTLELPGAGTVEFRRVFARMQTTAAADSGSTNSRTR